MALKTVNLYDRDKRHQMLNDLKICLGNNHQSDNLIRFYGAFYHEGMIKIILELMDLGSLRDLIDILKYPCFLLQFPLHFYDFILFADLRLLIPISQLYPVVEYARDVFALQILHVVSKVKLESCFA